MAIDVHAHFWTDAYLDKVAALGKADTATQRGMGAGDGAELDARLALMDRAGSIYRSCPHPRNYLTARTRPQRSTRPGSSGPAFGAAVHDGVIDIPLERHGGEPPRHPLVEGVVQEQVGEHR
jgi:hypothetical protein